ncbi:hypothetical protein SELMODRAFT_270271 [Selaginella moellendorffii]|uniref:BTB domain-containing protein n=1 Tax=Selaginella moellendorffii TaxID=88036 RepID=D8QRX0_SELML|nr:BTB/POZ and MATH domain-containing protein 4 [Selaginella moellendorffii]XP_002971221.1 BTB/POZ and MATH domain-containing protein 4 isoform X2 [Selaginella moellendorffii]EFJ27819.1 hypothetical protein SELMODRAFT_171839 [Selaginella moellendorffii]EFJ36842.1 hypothetical protein SELMODRAFT_270271 [Selaginella moellendorffii]|eukprot:XP_002961582.1 BTB/POZ and MATH domain-containing protein 4 [Selaginella moellendorffii]
MARTSVVLQDDSGQVVGSPTSTATPSRSRCITETVNGSHHFTIHGYSLAKGMGVGKYIASDTFTVGGYQWAIYFYPDGKNTEDNSLYVSVFIALASEGTDVRALFELTLLDQSGKNKHKIHSHFDRSLESGPYTLKYRGSMWGYKRFFRRAVLETSDFLKDDSLSITCTVGVVVSSMQALKQHSLLVPESDIGQHFLSLLESGEGTDVNFNVKGEAFSAHKLLLAARSPVFKAQLFGPMKDENGDVIEIDDMEPPVFKAMLHFIYKDSLPDTNEMTGSSSQSTATMMAQHLLAAADRFCLDRLRLLCESRLCEQITVDTVATTLALADQHHASQLKNVCLKFAASNLAVVMQSDGFEYLRESCPSLQSELLKTVAGVEEEAKAGTKNRTVWTHVADGGDGLGRRVRQKI